MRQAVVEFWEIFAPSLHRPSRGEVSSGTHCLVIKVLLVWGRPLACHRSQQSTRRSRAIPKAMADILDIFGCESPSITLGHENTSFDQNCGNIMRSQ
jgi:hypothetical protein